jgi:hypothetical protein
MLAIAGSIARLEASSNSDLDLIITTTLCEDGAADSGTAIAWRNELCATLDMDAPNKKGVFSKPVCRSHIEKIAGEAGEHYDTVAKRALLVLESQWVYNETNYTSLLHGIIEAYSQDVRADHAKNFVFLLNDMTRYFRALCVNYQFTKSATEYGKWPIRNIKLRHSRVLMYFSMVAAIGSLSDEQSAEKVEALSQLIRAQPLKRLYVAYALAGDGGFDAFAICYDRFLSSLAMRSVRAELEGLEYEKRYDSTHFAELKDNSDQLSKELLRFYETRRNQWDPRFFEYMII